jgi:carbonic anhydrase
MILSRFTFAYFLSIATAPVVHASTAAQFSYDPDSVYGPQNWGNVAVDGNACDGMKNSPIAVETTSCDRFEDYVFAVSGSHFSNTTAAITRMTSKHIYISLFSIRFILWCLINTEWRLYAWTDDV